MNILQARKLKIGCIPYWEKDKTLQVMIIRNRSQTHWIFPKGNCEHKRENRDIARLEAYEESGVIGSIVSPKPIIILPILRKKKARMISFYPLHIEHILNTWPEAHFRHRRLVSLEEADMLLSRDEHQEALQHFRSFLNISSPAIEETHSSQSPEGLTSDVEA